MTKDDRRGSTSSLHSTLSNQSDKGSNKDSTSTLGGFDAVQKLFNEKKNHSNIESLQELEEQLMHDSGILREKLKRSNLPKSDKKLFSSKLVTLQKQQAIIDAEKEELENGKYFDAATGLLANHGAREVFGKQGEKHIVTGQTMRKVYKFDHI
jgi:hypothetical protein